MSSCCLSEFGVWIRSVWMLSVWMLVVWVRSVRMLAVWIGCSCFLSHCSLAFGFVALRFFSYNFLSNPYVPYILRLVFSAALYAYVLLALTPCLYPSILADSSDIFLFGLFATSMGSLRLMSICKHSGTGHHY